MRRRWSQIAGAAVALLATLIVLLLNNQLRQGEQATATPRPATALAAAPSASATATATRLPATTAAAATGATTTATKSDPATAPRTATTARATATATAQRNQPPTPTPDSKTATVALTKLPPEAQQTIRLIDQGGPFPYDRDGIVFGNRERLLPLQADGYYHEYTVITPGSSDRGERRIIAGSRGELYYTDDHYESFRRVIR